MAISGNKGEWSEIYTLFKLLGDGKIYAGDADLNKLDLCYPILNIIREECKKYEYKPNADQDIVVIDEDGNEFTRISMKRFLDESTVLLDKIKNNNKSSFEIPETEAFMCEIGCTKLKAPSSSKADIRIVLHDFTTGMTPTLGFSIKSQLGKASTLLNAGIPTNITYKVTGAQLTDEEIEEINGKQGHLPRIKALYDKGCSLEYSDIEHPVFKNNLFFVDCCMPRFVAACLLASNKPGGSSSIKDCVAEVARCNPFNFSGHDVEAFYAHKMKMLLLDTALGMTSAKEWTGKYEANGGYLVVRKDGEIVCYHFYNRNDIEDYLYNNTRFERASRRRYHFGSLYKADNGSVCVKLNLQIRFKR